jgi:hypothetical protein
MSVDTINQRLKLEKQLREIKEKELKEHKEICLNLFTVEELRKAVMDDTTYFRKLKIDGFDGTNLYYVIDVHYGEYFKIKKGRNENYYMIDCQLPTTHPIFRQDRIIKDIDIKTVIDHLKFTYVQTITY